MDAWILAAQAFTAYALVLCAHSLRHRFGLAVFYALLGCLTAISCWETDAGVMVKLGDITFLVGSTVFYTSLLLGVFVVYVFDGPRATQVAILTVIGGQVLVAFFSLMLHLQFRLSSTPPLAMMPVPSLRANLASILTNLTDLVFLVVCWEHMHGKWRAAPLAFKAFLTLLGVMWLDVVLFNTGAFLGKPDYMSIMGGTLISRLIVSCFTAPILWAYLSWQNIAGVRMPHRPLFAILQELSDLRVELRTAREEIAQRRQAESRLMTEATMDPLTGVLNRRGFTETFTAFSAKSGMDGQMFTVLYLDVDRFKAINDLHGHATGDHVLLNVALAVRSQIRGEDFVGRIGGDEFAVFLAGAGGAEAQAVATRILDMVSSACKAACGDRVEVSASIGFAQFDPAAPCTATELLDAADKAMFLAKRRGGNQARPAKTPG